MVEDKSTPQKRNENKWRKRISLGLGWLLLLAGVYMLTLVFAPRLFSPASPEEVQTLQETPVKEDRIIMPKIKVNTEIREGGPEILRDSAWHRWPERGNPVDGGNFIVTAHRFVLDYTPGGTRHKSFFYNIDKMEVGDEIIIHYEGKKYTYKVARKERVKPTDVYIEDETQQSTLTVYSCTLGGSADGREVLIAYPVEE